MRLVPVANCPSNIFFAAQVACLVYDACIAQGMYEDDAFLECYAAYEAAKKE